MECDDAADFAAWIREWRDLMEFEVVPALPSAEVRARFDASLLET